MTGMEEHASDITVHLHVPSTAESGGLVRAYLHELGKRHDADDEAMGDLLLAVGEAFANAVEHGKTAKPVEIEAHVTGERMTVDVWDHGVGFAVEIHRQQPDPLAERGRGLGLMASLAESCLVASAPGWGTRITICGRLRT
jgi:serine/threonine-protein kinase RsbW